GEEEKMEEGEVVAVEE
ncbi:protein fam98b-like, partial [Nannochloropsis oceanica]